jgi:hypothetical protein
VFIGRFRDECLNEHLFGSLKQASQIIEAWRLDYNTGCPPRTSTGSPNGVCNPPDKGSWLRENAESDRFSSRFAAGAYEALH